MELPDPIQLNDLAFTAEINRVRDSGDRTQKDHRDQCQDFVQAHRLSLRPHDGQDHLSPTDYVQTEPFVKDHASLGHLQRPVG